MYLIRGSYPILPPLLQPLSLTRNSCVIAVALGVIPVLSFVHGVITGSFRKQAKVPYPHSYATVEQCKENVRLDLHASQLTPGPY